MDNFSFNTEVIKELWGKLNSQQRKVVAAGAAIALILFLVTIGSTAFLLTRENKSPIKVERTLNAPEVLSSQTSPQPEPTLTPSKKIKVDVAGAVNKPGVYGLEEGSRVQDAVEEAGGLSQEADLEYLSKHINLARIVSEADKIYVPKQGEGHAEVARTLGGTNAGTGTQAREGQGGQSLGQKAGQLINLNTASQAQLETLPGIGPAYAQRIIEGRPYAKVEEVMKVKGIGEKTFQKIKHLITVN